MPGRVWGLGFRATQDSDATTMPNADRPRDSCPAQALRGGGGCGGAHGCAAAERLPSLPSRGLALGQPRLARGRHRGGERWGCDTRPPAAAVAQGESIIKFSSSLNVVKDTYDHSCDGAHSDEYQHVMTDSPVARQPRKLVRYAGMATALGFVIYVRSSPGRHCHSDKE